jgi:hypothetical protein
MIEFNTEYFSNNLYFFLKESKSKISLYYSVAETLTESRKNDDKIDFDKKDTKKVKNSIENILKSKKKITKAKLKNHFDKINGDGELDELVDSDGSMLGSNIPILNSKLHPKKTMDQTVPMSRVSNDPVTRGYRVYWGESVNGKINIVSEVDYSEAFGYEETKDMDYEDTVETLEKMGVEDPEGRANEMGKTEKLDKSKKPGAFVKQRLSEKDSLEEQQKSMMKKMVEDIVTKKSKDTSDVVSKENSVSKILMKNLQVIKKLADKEGISVNQLIKTLKSNE